MRWSVYFLIVLLLLSCSEDEGKKKKGKAEKEGQSKDKPVQDGIARMYYPDGKLRAEIPMKGGRRNGLAVEYYNSGKKHLEINYLDGHNHGQTTRYYENGKLYEQTMYQRGEFHGVRKKYRQDGRLASEAVYNNGEPCLGLKEYLTNGELKKKYPTIVVETIDRIAKENRYILRLRMSDNSKSVTFYEGQLDKDNCIYESLAEMPRGSTNGVSEITFTLHPGMFVMEEFNFIAKVKTPMGNIHVTQRKYNLAIENR